MPEHWLPKPGVVGSSPIARFPGHHAESHTGSGFPASRDPAPVSAQDRSRPLSVGYDWRITGASTAHRRPRVTAGSGWRPDSPSGQAARPLVRPGACYSGTASRNPPPHHSELERSLPPEERRAAETVKTQEQSMREGADWAGRQPILTAGLDVRPRNASQREEFSCSRPHARIRYLRSKSCRSSR